MTDREIMQQSLEALELLAKYENPATKIQVRKPRDGGPIVTMYPHKVATEAAAPLRERLAQPTLQEAVVMRERSCAECGKSGGWALYCVACMEKLSRREWVGLSDAEICECAGIDGGDNWIFETAYAIEAKLKEKNA